MKDKIEIHLHTNTSCNLHCLHCYNNSGGNNIVIMPEEMVLALLTEFSDKYDAEFHLEGGEVFLRESLLVSMNQLPDDVLRNVTITTNGTIRLASPEVLSMLSRISALRLSVEGHTDQQQRAIRGIDITTVLENAEYYKNNHVPVWIRVTLNRNNYTDFLEGTLTDLQNHGFENIQVYEFQSVGRGKDNTSMFAIDDIGEFLNTLAADDEILKGNVRMMFPRRRIPEILAHKDILEQHGYVVELIGEENGLSIHANGDAYLCSWDNDNEHILFNVSDLSEDELFHTLQDMNLTHGCEYCSAIRIIKKANKC